MNQTSSCLTATSMSISNGINELSMQILMHINAYLLVHVLGELHSVVACLRRPGFHPVRVAVLPSTCTVGSVIKHTAVWHLGTLQELVAAGKASATIKFGSFGIPSAH